MTKFARRADGGIIWKNAPASLPRSTGEKILDRGVPAAARAASSARQNQLLAEYLPAMRTMTFAGAQQLADMGIPWRAIAAVCPAPMRITNRAGGRRAECRS